MVLKSMIFCNIGRVCPWSGEVSWIPFGKLFSSVKLEFPSICSEEIFQSPQNHMIHALYYIMQVNGLLHLVSEKILKKIRKYWILPLIVTQLLSSTTNWGNFHVQETKITLNIYLTFRFHIFSNQKEGLNKNIQNMSFFA